MTNNARRTRSDSTANLHRVLAGANVEIAPPCHVPLAQEDMPFWYSIIEEFAKADWSPHKLDMAAILARTMADLASEQRQLGTEGAVLQRNDGSQRSNPRLRIVNGLHGQVLAIRRSLGLTGRAKAGSTRDAVRLREANRRTERAADGGHDLLA